jgi:fluoride exporter
MRFLLTSSMINVLLIGLGGFLGTIARYFLSGLIAQKLGETFPWGTLIVNVTGSLIIGFIASVSDPDGRFLIHPNARQFIMIGILGGYTTFSSFSLQTFLLLKESQWLYAGVNVMFSVFLCMVAVWLGHIFGKLL